MKITKQKIMAYAGYIAAVSVGFVLYCIFRTTVIPVISGDLADELAAVRAQLPARSADGFITVEALSFDENYHVVFDIAADPRGLSPRDPADNGKNPEELFNAMKMDNSLCGNAAVKKIFRAGGTISVNLTLTGTDKRRQVSLSCEE